MYRQTEVTIYCDICASYHGTDILNLSKNVLERVSRYFEIIWKKL
jgi:hypothetical protein